MEAMKRSEALRAGYGSIATIAGLASTSPTARSTPVSDFAFAVGLGAGRAIGVLFDSPEIVVEDERGDTKRRIVPRAAGEAGVWRPATPPANPPGIDIDINPHGNTLHGHVVDQATGLCRGERGIYVAMWSLPANPYLVYYHVEGDRFWTQALPPSQRIVGLVAQPGRLYFLRAGDSELRSVSLVDSSA